MIAHPKPRRFRDTKRPIEHFGYLLPFCRYDPEHNSVYLREPDGTHYIVDLRRLEEVLDDD